MNVIQGLDLKKTAAGKATPAKNFMVNPNDSRIVPCQSWNNFMLYRIKKSGRSGKEFSIYEVVKVMRKNEGGRTNIYVIDRLFHTKDVVKAYKYMNMLRKVQWANEIQKEIVRKHRDEYIPIFLKRKDGSEVIGKDGRKVGYVIKKYPEGVQKIVDARKAKRQSQRNGSNSYGTSRSNGKYQSLEGFDARDI